MEFSCARDEFSKAVRIASRALGRASSMPILSGMKLQLRKNTLTISATDLERAIECTLAVDSTDEANVVLNGEILSKVTSTLPADTLAVRTASGAGKCEIACGGATFDLFMLPLEDYPEIPALPPQRICVVERPRLERALEQTTFAALSARETSRLSLTGIDMLLEADVLKLVATNGYRLALKDVALGSPASAKGEYLVAADACKDLASILALLQTETVEIYQGENFLFFQAGPVLFSARTIHEEYPDFERVIPRDNPIGLVLDRIAFFEALQRAQITAADESGAVVLSVEDGKLRVSSQAAEKGEAQEVLDLKKPADAVKASYRAEYLIDALKRMASEEVTFWLADAESAGLLEPAGAEADRGFIYVCMPIRMDF